MQPYKSNAVLKIMALNSISVTILSFFHLHVFHNSFQNGNNRVTICFGSVAQHFAYRVYMCILFRSERKHWSFSKALLNSRF
jgi:hypothetical protein